MKVGAILLCAGRGQRLGAGVEKAHAPLAGRPLFTWSLETLEATAAIEGIVMVGAEKKLRDLLFACGLAERKIVAWAEGGKERQHSVAHGLQALPADYTHVAVHDSARALASVELVSRVIADGIAHGAALAALPLEDTLKRGALQRVEDTVPRAGLWRAQTPQVFRRDWLEAAYAAAAAAASGPRGGAVATDDATLVEAQGHPVCITPGETLNFKITTAQDLALAEAWLLAHPTGS